jgi:hypothetical protein
MSKFLSPGVYTTEKDLTFRRSLTSIRTRGVTDTTSDTTSGQIIPSLPPQATWILQSGFWFDFGFWFDNNPWID